MALNSVEQGILVGVAMFLALWVDAMLDRVKWWWKERRR